MLSRENLKGVVVCVGLAVIGIAGYQLFNIFVRTPQWQLKHKWLVLDGREATWIILIMIPLIAALLWLVSYTSRIKQIMIVSKTEEITSADHLFRLITSVALGILILLGAILYFFGDFMRITIQ